MCVGVVLWCNVWVINVGWGRGKKKPDPGIYLIERHQGASSFNVPTRRTNRYQQYICLLNKCTVERFGINLDMYWIRYKWLKLCPIIPPNYREIKIITYTRIMIENLKRILRQRNMWRRENQLLTMLNTLTH